MESPNPLAPDYYLNNFKRLIGHALEWYADLLDQKELAWLRDFDQLSKEAQCLLVRLYSRKGELFRTDKLNYIEINSIENALDELTQHQFVILSPNLTLKELADKLLTKNELCPLVPNLDCKLKKAEMVENLSDETLFDRYDQLAFTVIQLAQSEMIDLLLALFFANTHQDLTQFVLDDLGLHQFENYKLSKDRRFFNNRAQLDDLLSLGKIAECYWLADRKQIALLEELVSRLPVSSSHPYVERKRQHLINDIARDFERLEDYSKALVLFNQSQLPPSRERQARIFDKIEALESMSDVVTDILNNPCDVSEQEMGEKLQQRLLRKQGQKVPRRPKSEHDELYLTLDLSQQRVELKIKEHFESQGWDVYFAENTLLNGLLGLAMWEAIFAPVEGAFINAYQHKPLDLYHADFASKRDKIISSVLNQITNGDLTFIADTYQNKFGIANPFVSWSHLPKELLNLALSSISPSLIAELLQVQLSDLKLYRNGMPDLIAFKNDQFRWIEVKGPGDKLQDNQLRWIHHFQILDVPFTVCYVQHEAPLPNDERS